MRNNIIANCPADVGIYVNAASDLQILNTTGIDMRFTETTGEVKNNLLMGKIQSRDGSSFDESHNLSDLGASDFQAWFNNPDDVDFSLVDDGSFVDMGTQLDSVTQDYCPPPPRRRSTRRRSARVYLCSAL